MPGLKKQNFALDLKQTAMIQSLLEYARKEGSVFPDEMIKEVIDILDFDTGVLSNPDKFLWHIRDDAIMMERIEFLKNKGFDDKNSRRLAEINFAYEVELLVSSEGKIIGAEGYYLSNRKYSGDDYK